MKGFFFLGLWSLEPQVTTCCKKYKKDPSRLLRYCLISRIYHSVISLNNLNTSSNATCHPDDASVTFRNLQPSECELTVSACPVWWSGSERRWEQNTDAARTQSQVELSFIPKRTYMSSLGCSKSSYIWINLSGKGISSVCLKYKCILKKQKERPSNQSIQFIHNIVITVSEIHFPTCFSLSRASDFLLWRHALSI